MAITALDIKDKQFTTKFRGYNEQEVDEFLDIIVDDYEDLVRDNRELAARVKELEEKLAYFDEMKELFWLKKQLKKLKLQRLMNQLT